MRPGLLRALWAEAHVAPHLGLWAEPILTAPEELPVVR